MFYKKNNNGYREVLRGIKLKTLTYGQKTSFTEFKMEKGSVIPPHSHINEQTGYLIKGKLKFIVRNEVFQAEPGDSWCIESNVEHSAEVIEDSLVVEVFSPVRKDYLSQKEANSL
jgi:quercetin dioxygenase-like cupin family protein